MPTAATSSATPTARESDLFRQYIAGLQANLPSLMLLFAPFVNSYRRFVKGSQAPVNFHWGYDNRTAGLRIPRSGAGRAPRREPRGGRRRQSVPRHRRDAGRGPRRHRARAAAHRCRWTTAPTSTRTRWRAPSSLRTTISCATASPLRLFGERFVRAYAAVKEVEYESWLAEIGAWERRFLVAQA